MGVRSFQVQQGTWTADLPEAGPGGAALEAMSRSADLEIRYALIPGDGSGAWKHELTSAPPLNPQDTLGQVLFGKPYSALGPAEQGEVDRVKSMFTFADL